MDRQSPALLLDNQSEMSQLDRLLQRPCRVDRICIWDRVPLIQQFWLFGFIEDDMVGLPFSLCSPSWPSHFLAAMARASTRFLSLPHTGVSSRLQLKELWSPRYASTVPSGCRARCAVAKVSITIHQDGSTVTAQIRLVVQIR